MPRAAGQIDRVKTEAILDAAAAVLTEKGLAAPMAMIARRAKVSKQTIYNHYGAKTELIHALVLRRSDDLIASLSETSDVGPEEALVSFAKKLLYLVCWPRGSGILRLTIQSSAQTPALARDVLDFGPAASVGKLAVFIGKEMAAGRLGQGDPNEAAEMFSGMIAGHKQAQALLGFPVTLSDEDIDGLARRQTTRFMRAYAV